MEYTNLLTTQMKTGEDSPDQTFGEYIEEQHMLENPHMVKDQLEEDFDNWLSELEYSQVVTYAKEWGARCPNVVADDYWKKHFGLRTKI